MRNTSFLPHPKIAILFAALCLCIVPAWRSHAGNITWTGSGSTTFWSDTGNWSSAALPGLGDVVWIDASAPLQPFITGADAVCSGIILQQGATLKVDGSYALHVIGEGDLDNDGVSDMEEYLETLDKGVSMDVDNDGILNYEDEDSDDDGGTDACEFSWRYLWESNPTAFETFHPYIKDTDPDSDYDNDEATNTEECAAGTNPTDPDDKPAAMPAYTWPGLFAALVLVVLIAAWAFRRGGRWAHIGLALIISGACIGFGGFVLFSKTFAQASFTLDFDGVQTLQAVAASATGNDTIYLEGGSIRPWNGATCYVSRLGNTNPMTLEAVNGAVYLGGMRAQAEVRVQGQGKIRVQSLWSDPTDFPGVDITVHGGTQYIDCYLGEKFTLDAIKAPQWEFYNWTGDATGTATSITYQGSNYLTTAQGNFLPPGPDLQATWTTGPPQNIKAGVTLSVSMLVKNIGQTAINQAIWADGIYLSRDTHLDDFDLRLNAPNSPSGSLNKNASYTQGPVSVPFPDVAPGQYYLLGIADAKKTVSEYNRDNNTAAATTAALNVNLAQ